MIGKSVFLNSHDISIISGHWLVKKVMYGRGGSSEGGGGGGVSGVPFGGPPYYIKREKTLCMCV